MIGCLAGLIGASLCALVPEADAGLVQGPGELAVAPTRIVLEGRERAAELVLANRGGSETTYRLSMVDMRMTSDGRLERLSPGESDDHSAKALVRVSPRQVTLGPGATQRVRVAASRSADLPDGEYRSHLLFEALPKTQLASPQGDPGALSLRVQVVGAVSLPIIVRQGRLRAEASLDQLRIVQGALFAQLHRTGARTIRGDLAAYFTPEGSKSKQKIGLLKELALYSPNTERQVRIPLSMPAGMQLRHGRVLLTFEEPPATKDRARASAELPMPD